MGGGGRGSMFIYSDSARLISFKMRLISIYVSMYIHSKHVTAGAKLIIACIFMNTVATTFSQ